MKKFGLSLMATSIAILLGLLFGSGCEGFGISLVLIATACILVPVAIHVVGRNIRPVSNGAAQLLFSAFLLLGGALLISGIVGIYRNGSFLNGACAGARTATRFTLYVLKVVASTL